VTLYSYATEPGYTNSSTVNAAYNINPVAVGSVLQPGTTLVPGSQIH
jgi:hypothetical protein